MFYRARAQRVLINREEPHLPMVVSISEKCVDYENQLLTRNLSKTLFLELPHPQIFSIFEILKSNVFLVLLNI